MENVEMRHSASKLYREISFTNDTVDVEKRTVKLAFASEVPYERVFGNEILNIDAQSIRLGRLLDGAPLLWNHNRDCQIGVVESVEIGSDRVARAVVRFGKGEDADEVFQDVVDNIRRKVSVGYMVYHTTEPVMVDGMKTYHVDDWEPFEISIVSIPADNGVGIGRSLQIPERIEKKMSEVIDTPAAPAVDVRKAQNDAVAAERQRMADLMTVGKQFRDFGGEELAEEMIKSGGTVDQLNVKVLQRVAANKPTATSDSKYGADIGLTEKEARSFSFVKAYRTLIDPSNEGFRRDAGFELECSRAAKQMYGDTGGILVPADVLNRGLVAGTGSAGGYAVDTTMLTQSFISILRKKMAMNDLGVTTLSGLVGNIMIPRQNGTSSVYWVGENKNVSETQPSIDMVTMQPKTVGAFSDVSRTLLMQSSLDIEAMVRNDLAESMGLEIDRVALYGTGAAQPTGLKGHSIGSKSFATLKTPVFNELVDMETAIAALNADVQNMVYLTNATIKGNMKKTQKVTGQDVFLWDNDELNGYRAKATNQVEDNDVWFGNWSDLLIGLWGGLELDVDRSANFLNGGVRIRALHSCDVAVRRLASFVRGA